MLKHKNLVLVHARKYAAAICPRQTFHYPYSMSFSRCHLPPNAFEHSERLSNSSSKAIIIKYPAAKEMNETAEIL
jgi:hypothetical protein